MKLRDLRLAKFERPVQALDALLIHCDPGLKLWKYRPTAGCPTASSSILLASSASRLHSREKAAHDACIRLFR